MRKSGTWLKTALLTAAGALRVKTSNLRAHFLRIKVRHGAKKATVAASPPLTTCSAMVLSTPTLGLALITSTAIMPRRPAGDPHRVADVPPAEDTDFHLYIDALR